MSDNVAENHANLEPILPIVEALTRSGTHEELRHARISEDVIELAVTSIRDVSELADNILTVLFPTGITATDSFYDRLADVEYRLGHQDCVHELNGLIWAHALSKLEAKRGYDLLESLAQDNSRSFFVGLYALPTLLKTFQLPTDYFCGWILSVRARLGNDMASGGFWHALRAFAEAFPERALEVVKMLSGNPVDENTIAIAANLLGHLRVTNPPPRTLSEFNVQLRDHQHVERRLIFHRSWITTGLERALTKEEFAECIHLMSIGTKEEVEVGINVLRILLPLASTDSESFLLGLRWIHERTTNEASDFWKYFVVVLARQLHERWRMVGKPAGVPSLVDLLPSITLICDEHQGTWNELEQLLVYLLEQDESAFVWLLFELAQKLKELLSKRFRNQYEFHDIKSAMNEKNCSDIVVDALLSNDDAVRHLGFSLFDGLGLTTLSDERLNAATDDRIAILIFSFQIESFYDEVIARFLLALDARVRIGSRNLQGLFIDELIYQSKNLPGGCLEALKVRNQNSPLMRRAIDESERYFAALRPCFRSAVNSMGIPGLDRATRVKASRQSREMRAQMNKSSMLTHLCSTSYTLYGGKKWQTFMGGKLGQISEMQEISHTAELPRMPGIDPEGVTIRRRQATLMIRRLLAGEISKLP